MKDNADEECPLTVAAGNGHLNVHSRVFFDDLQRRIAFNITPSKLQARTADGRPLGGSRNLFDGFGSHGVDEADGRPVQDDGVDGAARFRYQGLLQPVL